MVATTELDIPDTDQSHIKQQLEKHLTILNQKFKINKIGLFGSYARNQATPESDIDILVEFYEPKSATN